jgi:uncharacterized protein YcfJ
MKNRLFLLCALTASGLACAQEVGQVISRTPVYQQVVVPQQTCQQVTPLPAANSGGGAVLGAVVGGLIGNVLGGEGSRGIATMAGVIGGAVVGDRAESDKNNQPVTTCSTQNTVENRLIGYNVVYEYAGKTYNVQLPQDPGPTLAIQVTPAIQPLPVPASPAPAAPVVTAPVVYTQPSVVYVSPPPYYRPWPVTTNIHMGWGWYGGGHRHWR